MAVRKFVVKASLLLLLPLLAIEGFVRITSAPSDYDRFIKERVPGHPTLLFLGKSWIGNAIDPKVVESELGKESGEAWQVRNFGRGGATLAMHLLGLQHLLRKNKDSLNGTWVVVEAARGLPDLFTRKSNWINDVPGVLAPYLSWGDLPSLWASETPRALKFFNSLGMYLNTVAMIPRVQEGSNHFLSEALNAGLMGLRARVKKEPVATPVAPLRAVAGVMQDEVGIRHHRAFIEGEAKRIRDSLKSQRPFEKWEELLAVEIVELVENSGGEIFFLNIPQSSFTALEAGTEIGRKNAARFASLLARWDSKVIDVSFATTDEDFPDLSHLTQARAQTFSKLAASKIYDLYQSRKRVGWHSTQ